MRLRFCAEGSNAAIDDDNAAADVGSVPTLTVWCSSFCRRMTMGHLLSCVYSWGPLFWLGKQKALRYIF
jgi:hypothetical protein